MKITTTHKVEIVGSSLTLQELRELVNHTEKLHEDSKVNIQNLTPHPQEPGGQTRIQIKIIEENPT